MFNLYFLHNRMHRRLSRNTLHKQLFPPFGNQTLLMGVFKNHHPLVLLCLRSIIALVFKILQMWDSRPRQYVFCRPLLGAQAAFCFMSSFYSWPFVGDTEQVAVDNLNTPGNLKPSFYWPSKFTLYITTWWDDKKHQQ